MGRRIPVVGDHEQLALHPALSWSLMVVGMAATMAIITGMCGLRRKTPAPPSSPTANPSDEQEKLDHPSLALENDQEKMFPDEDESQDTDGAGIASLPLPPALQALGEGHNMPNIKSHRSGITKSTSTRNIKRLKSNLSTMTRSMSLNVRQINKAAHNVAHKGNKAAHNVENMIIKPKPEDSLWKKQIILGEKCRVPVDDGEGIIYDTKGNRISTFHKKTASSISVSMSRTTSSVDLNLLDKEKCFGKKEEEDGAQDLLDKEKEIVKKEEGS